MRRLGCTNVDQFSCGCRRTAADQCTVTQLAVQGWTDVAADLVASVGETCVCCIESNIHIESNLSSAMAHRQLADSSTQPEKRETLCTLCVT